MLWWPNIHRNDSNVLENKREMSSDPSLCFSLERPNGIQLKGLVKRQWRYSVAAFRSLKCLQSPLKI